MTKLISDEKGQFCYFCKDYFFASTEYLVEYKPIPGMMMDGDFCDHPDWICCCSLDSCQKKFNEIFRIIKQQDFDSNKLKQVGKMSTAEKLATQKCEIQGNGKLLGVKALNNADKNFDRIISIGDVHGCFDSLTFLIDNLKLTKKDLVIFVGDYVDRGPDAPSTIEYLLDLNEKHSCVFMRGNHDSMMLSWLGFGGMYGRYWLDECNGGQTTLRQYKVSKIETKYAARNISPNDVRALVREKIPAAHVEFLQKGLMFFEMDHAFYSHAGFESNFYTPYDSQTEEAYTWTREGFIGRGHTKALKKIVVHGHTINRPDFKPYFVKQHKQINLDSGCFRSGTLSSLIVNPKNENDWYFAVSNVENKFFELEPLDGKYCK